VIHENAAAILLNTAAALPAPPSRPLCTTLQAALKAQFADVNVRRDLHDTVMLAVEAAARATGCQSQEILPGAKCSSSRRVAVYKYEEGVDAGAFFAPLLWSMVQGDIEWSRYTDMY
jgi:hypothetical protein